MITRSCKKNDEVNNVAFLEKSWTQSFEEKTSDEIEIYRPSDFVDFPLSRYRQIFKFDDNACHYLVLAENDGHYMAKGSWEYNDKTNIIKIFSSNSQMIYEFEVVEVTEHLLKMKLKN